MDHGHCYRHIRHPRFSPSLATLSLDIVSLGAVPLNIPSLNIILLNLHVFRRLCRPLIPCGVQRRDGHRDCYYSKRSQTKDFGYYRGIL